MISDCCCAHLLIYLQALSLPILLPMDFHAILSARLAQQPQDLNGKFLPLTSPSLSRQESRQNSTISTLLNPNDDIESVSSQEESKSGKSKVRLYTVHDIIDQLSQSARSQTRLGLGMKEKGLLLAHLFRMLNSCNPIYVPNEYSDEELVKLLNIQIEGSNGKSSDTEVVKFDSELWLRCIVEYACAGMDDVCTEVIDAFIPKLLKIIESHEDEEDPNVDMNNVLRMKTLSIWCISSCLLFLYYNAENHGMINQARMFISLLNDHNYKNNDYFNEAGIYALANCISLAWEAGRFGVDTFINDEVIPLMIRFLEDPKSGNATIEACGNLIGMCMHQVNPEKDGEFEYDELIELINKFIKQGGRKIGKDGKDAQKILRQVLHGKIDKFEVAISSKSKAGAKGKKSNKTVMVKTWVGSVRIKILQFVCSGNIGVWMLHNNEIKGMIRGKRDIDNHAGEEDSDDDFSDNEDDEEEGHGVFAGRQAARESEKGRSIRLNRARKAKEESEMDIDDV